MVLHKKAASALSSIQQSKEVVTVSLEGFKQEEIETLVTAVLEKEANPKRLARVIWEITAGWPLYAEQVNPYLVEDYDWRLLQGGAVPILVCKVERIQVHLNVISCDPSG